VELGLSLSTFRRLLDRGRELLRARLTRRGVVPAVALSTLGTAAVSPTLASETVRLTFSAGDSAAAALAQEVLFMMARSRLRTAFVVLAATGFAAVAWQLAVAQNPTPEQPAKVAPGQPGPEKPKDKDAAPYLITAGDHIYVRAANVFEGAPIDGPYKIVEDGIDLGPQYGGRVKVAGLTLPEAHKAIEKQLQKYAKVAAVESVSRFTPVPTPEERIQQLEKEVKTLREEMAKLREAVQALQKK
jgi:hypothetical protein